MYDTATSRPDDRSGAWANPALANVWGATNHVSSRQPFFVRRVKDDVGRGRLYPELAEHADDLAPVQRAVIHHVHHDLRDRLHMPPQLRKTLANTTVINRPSRSRTSKPVKKRTHLINLNGYQSSFLA